MGATTRRRDQRNSTRNSARSSMIPRSRRSSPPLVVRLGRAPRRNSVNLPKGNASSGQRSLEMPVSSRSRSREACARGPERLLWVKSASPGLGCRKSGVRPTAAISLRCRELALWASRSLMHRNKWHSYFDHRDRATEQRDRHNDTKRLAGLEVDHELKPGRLRYWQVGGIDGRGTRGSASGNEKPSRS